VPAGATATEALHHTIDLARHADALGLTRYWLAEHHNARSIASSSPELLIGQIAQVTHGIRVGSGGIMLPNHSPLKVAENFRVLEALFPGRIDLGLGRAPGTDPLTALALRRSRAALGGDDFPDLLEELLGDCLPEDHPFHRVQAVPLGTGTPSLFMLGSSDFGGAMAAQQGFGFAFAHHINPMDSLVELRRYREHFKPAKAGDQPYAILALGVVCADTDEEAERLAASVDLMWLRIGQGGRQPIATPEEARAYRYTPAEEAQRQANRARFAVGSATRVAATLRKMAASAQADEVMVMSTMHSHEARRRSYALLAKELGLTARASPASPAKVA
jgi:luciferase family oxidoreductase group 1